MALREGMAGPRMLMVWPVVGLGQDFGFWGVEVEVVGIWGWWSQEQNTRPPRASMLPAILVDRGDHCA